MKKNSLILILSILLPLVILLTTGSCSHEVASPTTIVETVHDTITVRDTLIKTKYDTIYIIKTDTIGGGEEKPDISEGNTPRPTDWEIPSGVKLYPAAMYVILDNDGVPVTLQKGDLLAAFINGTCHGVAEADTGSDGYTRCSLKVNLFQDEETRNDLNVELRYYSIKYKRIFTAPLIPFDEDAILGKLYAGYKPTLWSY